MRDQFEIEIVRADGTVYRKVFRGWRAYLLGLLVLAPLLLFVAVALLGVAAALVLVAVVLIPIMITAALLGWRKP